MGLIERFRRQPAPAEVVERDGVWSFDDWAGMLSSFQFGGARYTLSGSSEEEIGSSFTGMSRGAFMANGVVFACIANRVNLFSEARLTYRRIRGGRPGDLFAITDSSNPLSRELELLRVPWQGGTTGDLLARMLLHADVCGNAYVVRRAGRLTPLRPDWVTIIGGVAGNQDATVWHPDAEVLGYAYQEGGPALGKEPELFFADQVAHFAPMPDPEARFRGMSWLTPVVREVMADKAMNEHKLKFMENAATPNLVVKLNVDNLEKFKAFVNDYKQNHQGVRNAYETLFLAAGADVSVVGADMRQMDFKVTQGAGETRIAAAAGVPPVVVGLSEGLEAATYSNYAQARRRFADQTMRPLWRNLCGSLSQIIRVPSDAELWYDDRDIKALQEDQQDAATIFNTQAQAYRTLVDGGVDPDSASAAVASGDITLVKHSGLLSVQLQEPGKTSPGQNTTNGQVPAPAAAN